MGARQSKRSVDISSTPKKDAETGQAPEKLEKIEEGDVIKVQNGTAAHVETAQETPQEDGAAVKENEPATTPVTDKAEAAAPQQGEGDQAAPVAEEAAAAGDSEKKEAPTTPEGEQKADDKTKSEDKAEKKKKEKSKKKWSFRSISFSKKDKSKPSMSRDESKSNDLAKEAPVPEEGAPAKSEETSPSEPEVASPATEETPKETAAETTTTVVETKEKEEEVPAVIDIKSVVTSVSSSAESGVQKVVEESTKVVNEAKEAISTIVETGSKLIVEESKTTTVTESSSIIKTSTKTIEIVEETIAPPLPASPPPTEAPPPTPVAPQPIQQHEHEEMNGGGESMAEMPEENGLCENEKIDDLHDEIPKMNGHNESPVQQQVEEITECLLKTTIEEKVVLDNHLEVAVEDGKKD